MASNKDTVTKLFNEKQICFFRRMDRPSAYLSADFLWGAADAPEIGGCTVKWVSTVAIYRPVFLSTWIPVYGR